MNFKNFNEVLDKFNDTFAQLHEDYNAALFNGVKYEDMNFLKAGTDDFFNTLSNAITTYSKGNGAIVKSNVSTVKTMLNNRQGLAINKNKNKLQHMKLTRPFKVPGYIYTINVLDSLDTTILFDLANFDRVLSQLSQYSSGEIIDAEYQFLVGYDRTAVMGRALGMPTPIGESDFKKALYTSFRNGDSEPVLLEINDAGLHVVYADYFTGINSDLNTIVSTWNIIEGTCNRLKTSIDRHKIRVKAILDKAPQTHENAQALMKFMDSVKKSSIAIDEILNVYARVMRSACSAMLNRIQQDQEILLYALEEVK